jgi:hypothetical protein
LAPLSDPDGFAPGAESDGGSGAEAGLLNRGGSSPEADGPFDLGALAGALDPAGAFPDDGAALSGGLSFADGSRVNLGGPSLVSIPTGTGSAFAPFVSGSDPFGRNAPVPSQVAKAPGVELFLCSALDTVNNPSEFPARSASYTVPESSAIGTGSALYALASQNFPLIKIAIGTSDALPFAVICSTPTARGPESFFLGAFLSPGIICGRSSCAGATIALPATHATSVTSTAQPPATRRCRIFQKAGRPKAGWLVLIFTSDLTLGIVMKVNDKAPEFTLPDKNGKDVSLKDLRGKVVILFFYPRASTPG